MDANILMQRLRSGGSIKYIPFWKRTLDLTCILIALPVVLPLTLFIAAWIKLVSRGPVLFQQERIGYLTKRFQCLKFRSMRVDADTQAHEVHLDYLMNANVPLMKMDVRGDSRVIPGGWILRASGLDELPQLINVLRGDMSLIGPRPCLPFEYQKYQLWQCERFNAVPGLTGLWQVKGKNKTTFEEMMRLDIQYARSLSLAQDLKILFGTIPALITQVQETRAKRKGTVQRPIGNTVSARTTI